MKFESCIADSWGVFDPCEGRNSNLPKYVLFWANTLNVTLSSSQTNVLSYCDTSTSSIFLGLLNSPLRAHGDLEFRSRTSNAALGDSWPTSNPWTTASHILSLQHSQSFNLISFPRNIKRKLSS